jgi:hypothetical protein
MAHRQVAGRLLALALVVVAAAPATAQQADRVAYGSRAGMTVTIVSREGVDSDHAVVRVVHTGADAGAFCKFYVVAPRPDCVAETLAEVAARITDRIEGNCRTGVFTGLWGSAVRFGGRLPRTSEFGADWDFREEGSAEPLDGTTASGYDVALDQFRAICPGRLDQG